MSTSKSTSRSSSSKSSAKVLQRFGTFEGTTGEVRPLGTSGAFACSFTPIELVDAPVKLTKAERTKVVKALAGKRPEFTGNPDWMPEGKTTVRARIELVEVKAKAGIKVKLQAILPREELSADEAKELLDLYS